jgi:hypothetical protein
VSIPSTFESTSDPSSQPAADDWQPCQLEAHLVEVRSRQSTACNLVSQVAEPVVRRTLELYCAAAEELLDHLEGLHADDVLVGLLSPQEGE